MKKRTWIWTACGAAAALALLGWALAPRPVEVEVGTVTQGPFETTIDEDARTRLRDRYVVSAPLAGLLSRQQLREGDRIESGAVVATLQPAIPPLLDERTLHGQQARVEVTRAQVQRARARVEAARVALQRALSEARRSEQLASEGFISATQWEADRLAAQAAQKELDASVEERHVADHEVEQAQAALSAVQNIGGAGARSFLLRSPVAGRVLRIPQASETTVALGTPVIELGDTQDLEVVAELLTSDALRAVPGSRVVIERWGGNGALAGRVRRIEPSAFTKVSALGIEEQRVKVLIDLTSPARQWEALGDGFRVGVRIVTLSEERAVKVPVSAVFPLPSNSDGSPGGTAVFVLRDGRARRTLVEVVARNASHAWVKTGLAPGDPVIIYPPAAVTDGAWVKPRKV